MTPTVDRDVPKRAMAVGAHPDDVEFGCGGTLAKWAAAGCEIAHVVCTDGSKGSWDPSEDIEALVAMRAEEQRAASRALGGLGEVVFLGGVDGMLHNTPELQEALCLAIRRFRPEVILGHDPWKRYRLHPDHRAAGFLLTDSLVASRDPHFWPGQLLCAESLQPHRPATLLLWEADEPDHVEDIESSFATKINALLCHRSQLLSTMDIEDPDDATQREAFVELLKSRAADHGRLAGVAAAESFKRIDRL